MNSKKTVQSTEKMDSLDKKILGIISQNARIPFRDVAAQCGVSRAAIHQRVQRMFDLGVITGYHQVVAELDQIPEVVESHFTTGRYTMMIKLYARDNSHLMELINGHIQEIKGVTATETLISLDESIRKTIPIIE